MKEVLVVLLLMSLCLTIPAMAAFPATMEEASAMIGISTSQEFLGSVEEDFVLYDLDFDDSLYTDDQWNQRYIVRDDISLFVRNKDNSDNYLCIDLSVYVKNQDGKYVLYWSDDYDWGRLSVTEKGIVQREPTDEFASFSIHHKINAGETYELPVKDIVSYIGGDGQEAIFSMKVSLLNNSSDQYYWEKNFYEINNQIADAFIAEVKEQQQPSEPGNPFTDVPTAAYYHDAVLWALEKGITTGTTATTFSPEATCTRGQVVTFLWRAKGCPEPTSTENPFTDIQESDYFYKPVLWAVEKGITNGMTATTFGPNETCTSAHVVTFLWRANGKPVAETTGTNYYDEPVAWANTKQLLDSTAVPFAPANLSPRADIVTYLYRDFAE